MQAARKLFAVCQTKCPANLGFFAGHFRFLPDMFSVKCLANISQEIGLLSTPVLMHGGLICIAFCLSVRPFVRPSVI